MDSRNVVKMSNEDAALPTYLDRVIALQKKYERIADVPVTENLYFSGALGIAGIHSAAADIARSVIVQATGLHSPAELVVAAVVSPAWTPEFEWLSGCRTSVPAQPDRGGPPREQPGDGHRAALRDRGARACARQVGSGARRDEGGQVRARGRCKSAGEQSQVASPPPAPVPTILLLISDDAPVDRARIVQLAESAADSGVYPVWVSNSVAELPGGHAHLRGRRPGRPHGEGRTGAPRHRARRSVVAEPVAREAALAYAKRLASRR